MSYIHFIRKTHREHRGPGDEQKTAISGLRGEGGGGSPGRGGEGLNLNSLRNRKSDGGRAAYKEGVRVCAFTFGCIPLTAAGTAASPPCLSPLGTLEPSGWIRSP